MGVERDWQQGLMISFFFLTFLPLKKIKTIYLIYVELISQSLENLAKTFTLFFG